MKKNIFISAGDLSGDAHAARLMNQLRAINPGVRFTGIGGEAMIAAGLESIVPLPDISIVGIWEVARKYPMFRRLFDRCLGMLRSGDYSAFIPVDYPGFNMKLGVKARSMGVPVIYYIAPQLWAWGVGRASKLAAAADLVLTVFPFEQEFFSKFGIRTEYVGHPLLDAGDFDDAPLPRGARDKSIVFMPGSRVQEILRHGRLITAVRNLLEHELPGYRFTVIKSPLIEETAFNALLDDGSGRWEIAPLGPRQSMMKAAAGVVKTGTSTLEAALCGMPFAMFYKTSAISYFLGKKLIKLDYLSLANILTHSPLVPEFIQGQARADLISKEILTIVRDPGRWDDMQSKLLSIRDLLGTGGASRRAAGIISREIPL